jgi:hypothetical protein
MAAVDAQAKTEKKAKKEIDASGGNDYIGVIRENANQSEEVDASGLDSAIAALEVGACRGGGLSCSGRGNVFGQGSSSCGDEVCCTRGGGVWLVLPAVRRAVTGDGVGAATPRKGGWRRDGAAVDVEDLWSLSLSPCGLSEAGVGGSEGEGKSLWAEAIGRRVASCARKQGRAFPCRESCGEHQCAQRCPLPRYHRARRPSSHLHLSAERTNRPPAITRAAPLNASLPCSRRRPWRQRRAKAGEYEGSVRCV